MTQQGFFTKLENRGRIRISGADAKSFLQGLITADINTISPSRPLLYSCLLTPNGKFLHDLFIYEKDGTYVLDCEGGERTKHLAKLFSMYKLRAQVEIEHEPEYLAYGILNDRQQGLPDPRHSDMGMRSYNKPDLPERAFEEWDRHRINLLIPDGSRDMMPQSSTLAEFEIDKLNGVSFDKGCYLGQELTARMHYRGLSKKHLRRVSGKTLPAQGTSLFSPEAKAIGEMCSSCKDIGLALIKKDFSGEELHTEKDQQTIAII